MTAHLNAVKTEDNVIVHKDLTS